MCLPLVLGACLAAHAHVLCTQEAAKLEAALEKLRQEAAAAAAAAESKGAAAAQAAAAAERF